MVRRALMPATALSNSSQFGGRPAAAAGASPAVAARSRFVSPLAGQEANEISSRVD